MIKKSQIFRRISSSSVSLTKTASGVRIAEKSQCWVFSKYLTEPRLYTQTILPSVIPSYAAKEILATRRFYFVIKFSSVLPEQRGNREAE